MLGHSLQPHLNEQESRARYMDKFREEIKNELLNVSFKGHVVFGVLICERLYPNYEAFQQRFDWDKDGVVAESIAVARKCLERNHSIDEEVIERLRDELDLVTPDTEDFPGALTSFALDACNSIYSVLKYLTDKDIDLIADVATYARDTVDLYYREISNEEREIDRFVALEKKTQIDILSKLRELANNPESLIESF